jgi:hypothetical protein
MRYMRSMRGGFYAFYAFYVCSGFGPSMPGSASETLAVTYLQRGPGPRWRKINPPRIERIERIERIDAMS